MKRKTKSIAKAVGVGLSAAAVSAMLSGCSWFPFPVALYGPPPEPEETFKADENFPEEVYGPPSDWDLYDPAEDVPAPVYGPPGDDYDPALDNIECVYGPPEDFGLEEPAD